jgi:hypothetical protein
LSPTIAASDRPAKRNQILKKPCDARNPAVKRRLLPGRKKLKNKLDSAKMIKKTPIYPMFRTIISMSVPNGGKILIVT